MLWTLVLLHIIAATVGLISGYMAMVLRKGSELHRLSGVIFFVSMVAMTSTAAYVAVFMKVNTLNATVALFTLYLVTTSWWAARRRDAGTSARDVAALLFVLAVSAAGFVFGFEAASTPIGTKGRMPPAAYFIFSSVALLCSVGDVRMLRRGGAVGPRRILRHLWRMSFALLVATFSLYPGQAKLFPTWLRETTLLFVPHVLLIGSMLLWVVRMRRRAKTSDKRLATKTPRIVQIDYDVLSTERVRTTHSLAAH